MKDAQALRFAAVLVVLAGYVVVFRAGETRIGDQLDANARMVARAEVAERGIASRAALERERTRLRDRLRPAELSGGRGAVVERFLRDAAAVTGTHHTSITAVAAGAGSSLGTAGANATIAAARTASADAPRAIASVIGSAPVESTPLEVTLEGRYADVLATVRALSRGRVPASVEITSVARKNAAPAGAAVSVALRVVLERYADIVRPPASHVHAQPV
jgi:hypothetical protein